MSPKKPEEPQDFRERSRQDARDTQAEIDERQRIQERQGLNGITVTTPWLTLQGTGVMTTMLLLSVTICMCVIYVGWQMQLQHQAIVNGLNDVFLASILTSEQKQNLPYMLQEKVKAKIEEKAKQKTVQ
jgi:hypothetical protein